MELRSGDFLISVGGVGGVVVWPLPQALD